MKKYILFLIAAAFLGTACQHIEPGYIGVKVKTLGQNKGVEPTVLGVGRYWMGPLYDLYTYPIFVNIYSFTLADSPDSPGDESMRFQSSEGIICDVDVALSCHVDAPLGNLVFQTYRKEMMEIIKSYCRQDLNNFFVEFASKTTVESLYGDKKIEMLEDVTAKMKEKYNPTGIIISDVSYKSEIRFPENVSAAINAKIAATQIALQKGQEIMQAEADAKKQIAAAEGQYQSDLLKAKGNIALANSITANLIQYELAKKWNGVSPIYSGSGSVLPPFFSK